MKKTFFAWALAVAMISVSACNTTTTTEEKTSTGTAVTPEAQTPTDTTAASTNQMAYICPMKCEGSASMEPGKCPVCKMNLEKNPAYAAQ